MASFVARSASLPLGGAVRFEAVVAGDRRDCVVVRTAAGVSAFVNLCAHRRQPVVVDDRPFDGAGRLECRAHGAFYEPAGGLCVEGPCVGARLSVVAIREEDGALWVEEDPVDDSVYEDEP